MTSPSTSSFVKREPVIAAHLAAAVVGYVLAALVTHHVLGSATASALTQQLVPAVASGLLIALGFLVRHFVEPAAAKSGTTLGSIVANVKLDTSAWAADIKKLTDSGLSEHLLSQLVKSTTVEPPKPDDPPASAPAATTPTPIITGGGAFTTSTGGAQTINVPTAQPGPQPTQAEAVAAAQPVQPAPTQGA